MRSFIYSMRNVYYKCAHMRETERTSILSSTIRDLYFSAEFFVRFIFSLFSSNVERIRRKMNRARRSAIKYRPIGTYHPSGRLRATFTNVG